MVLQASSLEQVAKTVTQRTAELLCARVEMMDDRGTMLARSAPSPESASAGSEHDIDDAYIRVPIQLDGHAGHMLIAESPEGEAISPRLAKVIIEMALNQSALISRLPNQYELKNKFIYELLRGAPAEDEGEVLREGQIFGMDFSRPRAVILIDVADYVLVTTPRNAEARVRRATMRAQHVIASIVAFFKLPTDAICAYIGDGELAVLKASAGQDLSLWADKDRDANDNPSWADLSALKRATAGLLARLRHDTDSTINIGIGRYHRGIPGLARSYQDASAALSLGRRVRGLNQVHCLDELGVTAFMGVADSRTKDELAAHLLSPLDDEPELIATLDALFVENCCPSTTASRLCIHRNTLSYRLDKIASLTGLDPRRFDDAVQIRLATVLRSLRSRNAIGQLHNSAL